MTNEIADTSSRKCYKIMSGVIKQTLVSGIMTNEIQVEDIEGKVLNVGDKVLYARAGYKLTRSPLTKGVIKDISKGYINIEGDYSRVRTSNSNVYIYKL